MKGIKVMIAEDERLAREELAYLLGQEEDIVLLHSAVNGKELLEMAELHKPDVIFLDIQMPELDGIQTAKMLSSRLKQLMLVFTTAHEGHAVEAFELNAIDYLLKPYSYIRLKETLGRIRRGKAEQLEELPSRAAVPPAAAKVSKLLIDDGERLIVLDPDHILYAVREEKVIQLFTKDQQSYTSRYTLKELEDRLQPHSFFRPHRSYLINLNLVDQIIPWFNGAYNLVLKDAKRTQIPVSRIYARDLFKMLNRD